jgi:anti-sigma B factor antagonist
MPEPTIIAPEGELDIASVGEFRRTLADAVRDAANGLVIDLSEVSFIDSSGLGAVIEAHDRLRRKNRPVAVVAPRGTAAALVLTLTQLRRRLPVYESRREALAA